MPLRLSLCSCLAATGLAAQGRFTSPPGIGNDGDSVVSSLQPFNTSSGGRRFQYVVDDVRSIPGPGGEALSSVALRPDPAAPTSAARTANVTLVLDHADFAALSTTFATNYSGFEKTHPLGVVNLPATVGGAGFLVTFPLPVVFAYFGANNVTQPNHTALLVEFQTSSVVGGTNYSLDCVDGTTSVSVGRSTYLGLQPCVVPPNVGGFDIIKHGPSTSAGLTTLGQHALRGPANSFGVLAVGANDPDTDFNGRLCTPLRASLDLAVPVTSDALGAVGSFAAPYVLSFPDLTAGAGVTLFTQFAVFDAARAAPQLQVSLSDAVQFDVTGPATVDRRLLYSTSSASAPTGALIATFVPVMRFN
ncbi:MAG: hypothetical protein R3F56_07775 [Planctomycetota bacterium]